jgi:DNA-directed RNA polymerase specialized sigma24 family protein
MTHTRGTLIGDGPTSASVVLVGEQAGNDEDLAGKPSISELAFARHADHRLAMPAGQQQSEPGSDRHNQFTTTHWSVVLTAADAASPAAQSALEELCRTYWFPLYAFVRRHGLDVHHAQDVVQGFFAQLLERQSFRNRTPEQGRFRSFLLASLKYYLADLADHDHAAKRGGGQVPIALDALEAEERYRLEPADQLTPEKIFERRWALALLANVLERLEKEFADGERAELFRQLRPALFDKQPEGHYEALAVSLRMSSGAVRVAAHRIRQRGRELFRISITASREVLHQIDTTVSTFATVSC